MGLGKGGQSYRRDGKDRGRVGQSYRRDGMGRRKGGKDLIPNPEEEETLRWNNVENFYPKRCTYPDKSPKH